MIIGWILRVLVLGTVVCRCCVDILVAWQSLRLGYDSRSVG